MITKNIQLFRTNWRNQEGYKMSDWDENFIGSVHDGKLFGFYRMVNGIVDNIKADLSPKLQNAQDEQAIYEFLQNAADSQSSECAVIYDEEYFMVINNGNPFTEKDLKALLNSFQGTKSDKTKAENCGKIGRYGIGFKLAYRLMGKSDGADELLTQKAGPILYSWTNNTQFKELLNCTKDTQFKSSSSNDDNHAWLLKIILACFPVGLEESVKNLDYQDEVLFKNEEFEEFLSFINKHRERIDKLNMPQGSMFFLKFGPKKHEKLKESLLNIQSGIGYSMNTLKTLEKVILQETLIEKYNIDFEKFLIEPGTEDFLRIDPEFPNCPIEIALGFPKDFDQMKALKRAPNIYQFFPMRNERHSMAYFIHASSFAKITDRTRLDDKGEANIETFRYIAKSLKRNLAKYKQDNFDQFSLIYKALLLSDKSDEYDSELINNHLYSQMIEFIRTTIPTHKKNFYLKDLVVVKGTSLDIDPMSLGIGKEWFFWTDVFKDKDIQNEAVNNAKLGLKRWGIKELFSEGTAPLIDNWIEGLSSEEYAIFVSELKNVEFDENFLEKFNFIKCFRFSDNKGVVQYFSIKELQGQQNIFLMSERLMPVKEEIKALGFGVLEFNIQGYAEILKQLESQLDYLSSDLSLYNKITERTIHANLSPEQKHRLFKFLSELNGIRNDELRKLALFSNRYGNIVPLQGLIASDADTYPWLEDFKISKNEAADVLKKYFALTDSWELYEYVVVPNWNDLTKHSSFSDEQKVKSLYESVLQLFRMKPGMSKFVEKDIIYVDSKIGFTNTKSVFYYKSLSECTDYNALKQIMKNYADLYIPHQSVLEYFSTDPFRLMSSTIAKDWKITLNDLLNNCRTLNPSPSEKKVLFDLLKTIMTPSDLSKVELFENNRGELKILSQLIPSNLEVDSWLKPFQIKKSEDYEGLSDFLLAESEIYNNVIVENWESIITNPQIYSNIGSFYESIITYSELSKSPKTITTAAYIFVDRETGFVPSSNIVFHHQMISFDAYKDLRKAIFELSELYAPAPEVLKYLNNKPFKTRESTLPKTSKLNALLSKEEVVALMNFSDLCGDVFFKYYTVTDSNNSREYLVEKRAGSTPYFLEKSQLKLADKILESFGDKFKLLPLKLFQANLKNEGLIMGTALFNLLSKSKDVSSELLSAMIVESDNAEMQELVFGKIEKIILKQDKIYGKESFEHQSLQIFRNKDADFTKVREKIIIEDKDGNQFSLSDIGFDPMVNIGIEREGKFSLILSEILPSFKIYQELLDTVLNNFVDYEAPTLLKKRCFENNEMPLKTIFSKLKESGKELISSEQVAFLMLYIRFNDDNRISKDFQVENMFSEWISLGNFEIFHINKTSFIEPTSILSDRYNKLPELLKLNSEKKLFFDFANQKLAIEPFIDKGVFYCNPLKNLDVNDSIEEKQLELLDFGFKKWLLDDSENPLQFHCDVDWAISSFSKFVYPDKYALESERLQPLFVKWIGSDSKTHNFDDSEADVVNENDKDITALNSPKDKLSFLISLGLNAHQSALVKLRRYFYDKKGRVASQKQFNDIQNSQSCHLSNTILWLLQSESVFSSEDDRIHWLRKLYNNLDQISEELPLPVISEVKDGQYNLFTYKLKNIPSKNLCYFDSKIEQLLIEKYAVKISHVLSVLSKSGFYITNLNIKLLDIPLASVEENLDNEHLLVESKEWGANHYLKWREEVPYKIFIYDGKIPYTLKFCGHIIKIIRNGNAVVFEKSAYVNSHANNVEEALFEISAKNSISELMLLQLLRYKNETDKSTAKQPTIEKVIEKVLVPELVSDNEEIIENPKIDQIKELIQLNAKGQVKLSMDLKDIDADLIQKLYDLSNSIRLVVSKESFNKKD